MTLLNDRYVPITSGLGFLEAPLGEVAQALEQWRVAIHGSARQERFPGGFEDNVLKLEPLVNGWTSRELLVATSNPEWTAFLNCHHQGSSQKAAVSYLAETMGCHGLFVSSVPPSKDASRGPWGAIQFELYGPVGTPLNCVRAISLSQDGARWSFYADDKPVLDFEEVDAYTSRKIRDRFTLDMLKRYCAALGLHPFDPEFYPGPSILVTNASEMQTPGTSLTLAEVRERMDLSN
ncbi:hypothetical protein [Arthrobacter sp. lap29]|uniref:hypothetical protein n=1 Tax=Arthrobacter sp. lap29 TaxID=3056122 RepID=UPI0028F70539|nr:hypothetical protein [Arthrobacter sp. lap29]